MIGRIAAASLLAALLAGCQAPSGTSSAPSAQGAGRAPDGRGALPQTANDAPAPAKDSVDAPAAQAFMQRLDHYAESGREGAAAAEWFTLYDDYRQLPPAT